MQNNKILTVWVVVVAVTTVFLVYKMMPGMRLFPHVNMTFIKQNGSLQSVTDQRNPDFQRKFPVSDINFPLDQELRHHDYGKFGFKNDFFMDLTTSMKVKKEGIYNFSVASDDGFQLYIDNELKGEFLSNRQFSTNTYRVMLSRGEHSYLLKYYQGFGQLGLVAFYSSIDGGKPRLIGKNTGYISFKR